MSLAENIESFPQQTGGNYQITRFNALQHGVLSHYTILPWEDGEAYRSLIDALVAEHNPNGPTEEHLVEELAGIIWRKRRLRLGEAAVHHRALRRATDPARDTAKAALVYRRGRGIDRRGDPSDRRANGGGSCRPRSRQGDDQRGASAIGETVYFHLFTRARRLARRHTGVVGRSAQLEIGRLR